MQLEKSNLRAPDRDIPDTHEKALQINLDKARYGTFAEVGAGQEVARWFFKVGGAAGTVAKTMSAYDITFAEGIYGPSRHYVSRERMEQMLLHEYDLLIERLDPKRGAETTFFTFADTVRSRAEEGKDEYHGWLGMRYQSESRSPSNVILLHVRMLDEDHVLQQNALGILGVNILYGAFYHAGDPYVLLESLLDNLDSDRIEIDMVHFEGPAFVEHDNRLLSLHLVNLKLAEVAMFSPDGKTLQPSAVLSNKAILIERGNFRPITRVNLDMLKQAHAQFDRENEGKDVIEILEMTMHNLLTQGHVDPADFLERVDVLASLGKTVMISNYAEFYKLSSFLTRYTQEMVGIVISIPLLRQIFRSDYYEDLEGGVLEAVGRLFKNTVRLFVYPGVNPEGKIIGIHDIHLPKEEVHLCEHLIQNHYIQEVQADTVADLLTSSHVVARKIQEGDPAWEMFVVPEVADLIRRKGYFGWHEVSTKESSKQSSGGNSVESIS
jgi:hypothetical protein